MINYAANPRVHTHRIVGGNCNYRHSCRAVVAVFSRAKASAQAVDAETISGNGGRRRNFTRRTMAIICRRMVQSTAIQPTMVHRSATQPLGLPTINRCHGAQIQMPSGDIPSGFVRPIPTVAMLVATCFHYCLNENVMVRVPATKYGLFHSTPICHSLVVRQWR